jgi:GTP-binding protein
LSKGVIAIVGRPNVGKSAFFNHIVGKRISIVENIPGVTRDRIYEDMEWRGRKISLVDTGGLEPSTNDTIMSQMKVQAELAMDLADVVIFMVDYKEGLTANDMEIATILRKTGKPVIVAVNKVDNVGDPPAGVYEFYNLGLGDLYTVSAAHGLGIGEVLDAAFEFLPKDDETDEEENIIKVAIVGRPNAGKSSLVNKLLGENRVIVSDIPGTTRDAIDTYYENDGQRFCFIDTAGMRRKSKISNDLEKYSILRAVAAIERSDVVIIVIDANEGPSEQDAKIAGYAHDKGKASIIAVNKWDLPKKETGTLEKYRKDVENKLSFMTYAPVVFVSALTGQRVDRIFELVKYVADQASFRVGTGLLNDVINEAVAVVQPPSDKGRRLKVYYVTQVGVKPPTFVIFCNSIKLFHYSYERYIENQLRKNFGFEGTPIKLILREKANKSN